MYPKILLVAVLYVLHWNVGVLANSIPKSELAVYATADDSNFDPLTRDANEPTIINNEKLIDDIDIRQVGDHDSNAFKIKFQLTDAALALNDRFTNITVFASSGDASPFDSKRLGTFITKSSKASLRKMNLESHIIDKGSKDATTQGNTLLVKLATGVVIDRNVKMTWEHAGESLNNIRFWFFVNGISSMGQPMVAYENSSKIKLVDAGKTSGAWYIQDGNLFRSYEIEVKNSEFVKYSIALLKKAPWRRRSRHGSNTDSAESKTKAMKQLKVHKSQVKKRRKSKGESQTKKPSSAAYLQKKQHEGKIVNLDKVFEFVNVSPLASEGSDDEHGLVEIIPVVPEMKTEPTSEVQVFENFVKEPSMEMLTDEDFRKEMQMIFDDVYDRSTPGEYIFPGFEDNFGDDNIYSKILDSASKYENMDIPAEMDVPHFEGCNDLNEDILCEDLPAVEKNLALLSDDRKYINPENEIVTINRIKSLFDYSHNYNHNFNYKDYNN